MKLDRDINPNGRGKYALIKLREVSHLSTPGKLDDFTAPGSAVDFGNTPDTEFFVIRLKDKYAAVALAAYGMAAYQDDPEYGSAVLHLAHLAAIHPFKRKPD